MWNKVRSCDAILRTFAQSMRLALGFAFLLALPLQGQKFAVLYEFQGGTDGVDPQAGLVRDDAGNLYGTTFGGGETSCDSGWGCGAVFKIDAAGNEAILYRFAGMPDGEGPMAGLIIDNDGNLYGTTFYGGASNYGTVFKVTPSGQEAVLYSFGAYPDGSSPSGGLVMDEDGNLYGTTQEGGSETSCFGGCGTVFKLDESDTETILLNFAPSNEYPTAALILDAFGNLYGITSGNGGSSLGTVFRFSKTTAGEATTLHAFTGGAGGTTPMGSLIRDSKGHLYGMTLVGGDLNCAAGFGYGCGVAYELSSKGNETVLHSFVGTPDGVPPQTREAPRNSAHGVNQKVGQAIEDLFA
jgi:uncharacterized repeat protein (TIGR03803 family)